MSTDQDIVQSLKQIHRAPSYSQALMSSALLADDIEWWAAGPKDILPWAGTWRGPEGVAQFFSVLNTSMEYASFAAQEYIAQDDQVAVIISANGHARATGRPFGSDIVRVYTFRAGRIVKVRNYYDTASYVASLQA